MGKYGHLRVNRCGKSTRLGNVLRIALAFPAVIASLCIAAMLAGSPPALGAQNVQSFKAALAMYETDVATVHAGPGTSGAPSSDAEPFVAGSDGNSFKAKASVSSPPDSAGNSATVDATGFNLTSTITRQSGSEDLANQQFTVDFWVDAPLGYTFGGSFTSSSIPATVGSFIVTLDDLGAGTELFSHQDRTIPPGFSTTISDANSTGGLSGQFLPGTTYRLTVTSELDDDGSAGLPPVEADSLVTVSFSDVPEPGSLALLFAGGGSLLLRRRAH